MAAERTLKIVVAGDAAGAIGALGATGAASDTLGGKLGKLGKVGALAAGAALVGLGKKAFDLGMEFDAMEQNIAVATGATGDNLDALVGDFQTALAQVPGAMKPVADSIGTLNTLTGATGENLSDMAVGIVDASRLLKEEAGPNAESFGRVLAQWNVPAENATTTLDSLFKATQDYGVSLNGLTRNLTTFGPVMQNAGFTLNESADFMARLEAGGIQVTRVMPGLNAAFRKMAEAGKDPRQELERIFGEMQNASSEAEALNIATSAFGAEGAQRMTTAVRNGTISLADLGTALDGQAGLVQRTADETATLGEKWSEFSNRMKVAVAPAVTAAMDGILKAFDAVADWVTKIVDVFQTSGIEGAAGKVMDDAGAAIRKGFDALVAWLQADGAEMIGKFFFVTLPKIWIKTNKKLAELTLDIGKKAIVALWDGLVAAWPEARGWLADLPNKALTAIGDLGATLLNKGRDLISGLVSGILGKLGFGGGSGGGGSTVNSEISGIPAKVVGAIGNLLATLVAKGQDLISGLATGITLRMFRVVSWFATLPSKILEAIPDLAGVLTGLGGTLIQGFIDGVTGMASAAFNAISGVVNQTPSVGGGIADAVNRLARNGSGSGTSTARFSATGGRVPGLPGTPVPIIAHAGETIVPAAVGPRHTAGGGTGVTVNNFLQTTLTGRSAHSDLDRLFRSLREIDRLYGGIPVRATGR